MAIKGFDGGVEIEHPGLFEQGRKSAIHLLVDPSGDGVVVGVFESSADAVFAAEGLDAQQAGHDGVSAEDGDVGVAALSGEDGLSDGGKDFGFERGVGAGVSEGAGVDKLGPRVTGFEKVDEVSEKTVAGDGGARSQWTATGPPKVSTRWGGGKLSGVEEASPFG